MTQFFTGQMPFLPPNQQCQSNEGTKAPVSSSTVIIVLSFSKKTSKILMDFS